MSKNGKPTGIISQPLTRIERMCQLIEGGNGCWLWLGGSHKGYGYFKVTGERKSLKRVNRIMFELVNGREINSGLVIDHSCRNTICINPAHLREVTQGFNVTWAK